MPTAKPIQTLKHLSMTLRGPVSGWVIAGIFIAVTGFAPPVWIARLVHYVAAPAGVRRLLPLALDVRVAIVLLGIAIIVGALPYRSRHPRTPSPGRGGSRRT